MIKPKYEIPISEPNDALVQARVPKKYIYLLKAKGIKVSQLIRAAIKSAALDKSR